MARNLLAGLVFVLPVAAGPAAAQSFDCAKAARPDEKAICADRSLGDLDVKMATLWEVIEKVPALMGWRGAMRDAQRAFLTHRATCGGDTACLTTAYDARIAVLERTLDEVMQQYCKAIQLC